jgi:rhamnosyltransferase
VGELGAARLKTCSVTVAFNPNPARLAEQIAALRGQVGEIVIVDNGSRADVAEQIRVLGAASAAGAAVHVISLADNQGIGSGFNAGIERAESIGCNFILLLDHDSVPAHGMVALLMAAHGEASARGRVAAVGPRIRDSRDHHEFPFIRLGWLHNPRIACASDSGLVSCDFLISSGTLVSFDTLRRVGLFDAGLFIDFVDLEWCCRARALGYSLYGVCGARLEHELGEAPRELWGGMRILVHSPERLYYMTRNRLLLYRRGHVPLKWKLKDIARGALKVATALAFVAPRREYLRMTMAALRDGSRGAGGARLRP